MFELILRIMKINILKRIKHTTVATLISSGIILFPISSQAVTNREVIKSKAINSSEMILAQTQETESTELQDDNFLRYLILYLLLFGLLGIGKAFVVLFLQSPLNGLQTHTEKAIAQLEAKIDKLELAFTDDILTKEEFARKKALLEKKIDDYEVNFVVEEKINKLQEAFSQGILNQTEYEDKVNDTIKA